MVSHKLVSKGKLATLTLPPKEVYWFNHDLRIGQCTAVNSDSINCWPKPLVVWLLRLHNTFLDLQNFSCPTQPHSVIPNYISVPLHDSCQFYSINCNSIIRPIRKHLGGFTKKVNKIHQKLIHKQINSTVKLLLFQEINNWVYLCSASVFGGFYSLDHLFLCCDISYNLQVYNQGTVGTIVN